MERPISKGGSFNYPNKEEIEMTDAERFKKITEEMAEVYRKKNKDYGNSFHEVFKEWGYPSAGAQIGHKYNRMKTLMTTTETPKVNESLRDTLLDMANYCIFTMMEIDKINERNA